MEIFDAFRDALYSVLKFFQHATEPVLGSQSYWFSIVLLTISVRLLLIPLTVKQVRSTRVMQELQPELKKLQAKYKNDKQKLQEELMKLYRERGFNPLAGCWPLAAQLPFFWALYRVIYSKNIAGAPNILLGKTFFGVPLEDRWSTLSGWGEKLASGPGLTILFLIIAMAVTTYFSQRQLMAKQTAEVNPQQQMLLRIMPLLFVVFAINVPLAVVLYWVTTNLWSIGQQWVLLRNYQPPAAAAATAAGTAATDGQAQPRKGLGALAAFRSLVQPTEAPKPRQQQGTAKNGSGGAGSGRNRSAPPRRQQPRRRQQQQRAQQTGGQQPRSQQPPAPQAGGPQPPAQQADGQPQAPQPRAQPPTQQASGPQAGGPQAGGPQPRAQQAGGAAREGGEARSRQAGRPGAGGGRKPGSGGRPTGKGKSGGQQRRSKR